MKVINAVICFFFGHDPYKGVAVDGNVACLRCHDIVEVGR